MANTVNDVMNVIASPDYGIKNIAGTNQEILAIMGGMHNSKNNIHAIVDDIRSLLQTLVESTSKKKPVDMGEKLAKVNHKNIKDILDETKGIRTAIDNLANILLKQGGKEVVAAVAKLSDKASQRVADAMVKDMEKHNKNGGMSALVDSFTKLRDISLSDLIFGKKKLNKISELFKNAKENLKIDEKELAAIIKLVNAAPEMVKSLSKVSRKINRLIKNNTIIKLGDILVGSTSLLTISQILEKNQETFKNANKVTKDIKELVSSLKKTMRKLFFASLWAKAATFGVEAIGAALKQIFPLAQTLVKNQKDIERGTKVAKKITALVGNLLISSIFLTISIITTIPAIIGAFLLKFLINTLMPTVKKLAKNQKHLAKATLSALVITLFTGIMLINSILLGKITENAEGIIWGSLLVFGFVAVTVLTFKVLNKAQKNIIMGAILMAIMSISLIIFGIALGTIMNATKNATWKQLGIVAASVVLLGLAVAALGIPAVAPFILLGSGAMIAMSISLLFYGFALNNIYKATEKLTMKHVGVVAGSMGTFGLAIAGMAVLMVPVALGSIVVGMMVLPLYTFVKALKVISEMKKIPTKEVGQVCSAMKTVGNFFKNNKLKLKAVWNAAKYAMIMPPFSSAAHALAALGNMKSTPTKMVDEAISAIRAVGSFYRWNPLPYKAVWNARKYKWVMGPFIRSVRNLTKLRKLGTVPMKLVYQSLDAVKSIGKFFEENPLEFEAVFNARKYKWVLRPFGNIVRQLGKLKKMGSLPMKLVIQALDAMKSIADYFENNPISKEAIKASWMYGFMLRPFGYTIRKLMQLKKLGGLPMKLVVQTLDAMKSIADYYTSNPITEEALKASYLYGYMLRPFGYTLRRLRQLKAMGSLPMKLVVQTLDAMKAIADFYQIYQMSKEKSKDALYSAYIISYMVGIFGRSVKIFKRLQELRAIPTESIKEVCVALSYIAYFYATIRHSRNIEEKSEYTKYIVNKFIDMAVEIQDKFANVKDVNHKAVRSVIFACISILSFYSFTRFRYSLSNVIMRRKVIKHFTKTSLYLRKVKVKASDLVSINLAIKGMSSILRFLKRNTLNPIQRIRAYKNLNIISRMSYALSSLSNINPSNISSIGDALGSTLDEVGSIDISQVEAVTNLFNAFNGINKSENIINKFAESVKEFTTSCKELREAMSQNTDALNNADANNNKRKKSSLFGRLKDKIDDFIGVDYNDNNNNIAPQSEGVRIVNVDEIAKTIAEKINGVISVDMPDTQVQLTINGTGGNEWTITRY